MKQSEIIELSYKDLEERLTNSKDDYDKMKMNHSVSALENPMKIKELRRSIARLATELRSRELAKNNDSEKTEK